jgi:hypothetical protein
MNILETIHQRRSVRSFSPKVMEQPEIEKVQGMLETASSEPGPFGTRIRLKLYIDTSGSGEARMGTYGLISGASAFIMPVVVDAPGAMEDLGWTVERAIIDLWAAGWASCWIGGVFSRAKAASLAGASGEEFVPIVVALGREAEQRSLLDRLVTRAARSRQRKPLDELCFLPDGSALNGDALAPPWNIVLEALRSAPSASNKQPWRLVLSPAAQSWALFLDEDRLYNNSLGNTHLQNIDMGIAMYHFAVAAYCASIGGAWIPLTEEGGWQEAGDMEQRKALLDAGKKKGWKPIAYWA